MTTDSATTTDARDGIDRDVEGDDARDGVALASATVELESRKTADYISRVSLSNFQAHPATDIALAPGVTALIGNNNSGKSSIVEAIRCVAENVRNDAETRIHHGAKEAIVEIELSSGDLIRWKRSRKKSAGGATYEIERDGSTEVDEFRPGNQGPPAEVVELLRLAPAGDKDGVDVHIGNQREPVFLLGARGSQVADFFAANTEAGLLLEMRRQRHTDEKRLKSDRSRATAELDDLDRQLDALATIPDTRALLDAAAKEEQQLHRKLSASDELAQSLEQIRAARADVGRLDAKLASLRPLEEPPELEDTAAAADTIVRLSASARDADRLLEMQRALEPLEAAPELTPTRNLARDIDQIDRLTRAVHRRRRRVEALAAVLAAPDLAPTRLLAESIEHVTAFRGRVTGLASSLKSLEALTAPPVLEDPSALASTIGAIAHSRQAVADKRGELAFNEEQSAGAAHEIARILERLPECPTCGQPLSAPDGEHEHSHAKPRLRKRARTKKLGGAHG